MTLHWPVCPSCPSLLVPWKHQVGLFGVICLPRIGCASVYIQIIGSVGLVSPEESLSTQIPGPWAQIVSLGWRPEDSISNRISEYEIVAYLGPLLRAVVFSMVLSNLFTVSTIHDSFSIVVCGFKINNILYYSNYVQPLVISH